jgi:hypothetical protein
VVYLRAFGIWLLILFLAVLNGALREAVLLPHLSPSTAFVLSGALLATCVLGVSFLLVPRIGALSSAQCWAIGLFWLGLTLAFEFGFGRLVQHQSWATLLAAYRFTDGNVWPLVLVVILIAPWLAQRLVQHERSDA